MDVVRKSELEKLTGTGEGVCVSICLPTHRAGTETRQDPIRPTEADDLLRPARDLLSDGAFWRYQADGLALFLSEDSFRYYRLPVSFEELAVVADRYHLKPLLPLFSGDGRFYVLAISQNEVRLLRAMRDEVAGVDLENTPRSLAEALRYDDPEKQLQFHTGTGGGGGRPAVFHGHDPELDAKEDILRYFRLVDAGVTEESKGQKAPLVLAAVDYLISLYREASSHPDVLEEGVVGNPEGLRPEELRDRAWEIVQPRFDGARREALARYERLAGTGGASTDLAEIVPAAYFGRVDTLLVARGARRWGDFDSGSGEIQEHGEPERGDGDLLDLAAVQTFLNGGTVHVLGPEEMPDDGPVAAIFRY